MQAYQNQPVVRPAQRLTQPFRTLLLFAGLVFADSAAGEERVIYTYPYHPPVSSQNSPVHSVEHSSVNAPCSQCITGVPAASVVHQFGVASDGPAVTYHSFFRHQPISYVVIGNAAHTPTASIVIRQTTSPSDVQNFVAPVILPPENVADERRVQVMNPASGRVFSAIDAATNPAGDRQRKVLPPPAPKSVEPPADAENQDVPATKENSNVAPVLEMTLPGPPERMGDTHARNSGANRNPVPSEPKRIQPKRHELDLRSPTKKSVDHMSESGKAIEDSLSESRPRLALENPDKEKFDKAKPGKAEAEKRRRKKSRIDSKTKPAVSDLPNPLLAWNLDRFPIGTCDDGRESAEIVSRGSLRIDSNNGLDLQHGWVQFPSSSKTIFEGIRKSKAFSIAVSVTCANNSQKGPARILSCSKDTDHRNFTLGQDGKRFIIRIRTGDRDRNGTAHEKSFGTVKPGHKQLVVVTYDGRRLYCYVDGDNRGEHKFSTDFGSWERYSVVAGNEATGGRKWSGTIHSMVVLPTADPKKLSRLFTEDSD